MEVIIISALILVGLSVPLIIWAVWIVPFVRKDSQWTLNGGRIIEDYIQAERLCRAQHATPWFITMFRVAIVISITIFVLAAWIDIK